MKDSCLFRFSGDVRISGRGARYYLAGPFPLHSSISISISSLLIALLCPGSLRWAETLIRALQSQLLSHPQHCSSSTYVYLRCPSVLLLPFSLQTPTA
ncbi:hypothetical protein M441DRAFT_248098 [Trichoderma asperellum CBS 433.97]|uniref:Uncharacterized protein n=1 Tax=Trichoderma asperellum (strain ATCC 204424 / CBS 433.97 / NBRC 101777) TaxID=1042311 RepID=A0A2T3Z034_TRIA4|nr:hypothetical protein M441DRAFT_248098 [Trichoderma asperellum CBS 433.97]PTB38181.1 hypothetical protein M441DRAFT_248098 [Trichoderma asperellum CBS 433.97]